MDNGDWPASPNGWNEVEGLTKREYFAGLAMQAIRAAFGQDTHGAGWELSEEAIAQNAVKQADALLEALEQHA